MLLLVVPVFGGFGVSSGMVAEGFVCVSFCVCRYELFCLFALVLCVVGEICYCLLIYMLSKANLLGDLFTGDNISSGFLRRSRTFVDSRISPQSNFGICIGVVTGGGAVAVTASPCRAITRFGSGVRTGRKVPPGRRELVFTKGRLRSNEALRSCTVAGRSALRLLVGFQPDHWHAVVALLRVFLVYLYFADSWGWGRLVYKAID